MAKMVFLVFLIVRVIRILHYVEGKSPLKI